MFQEQLTIKKKSISKSLTLRVGIIFLILLRINVIEGAFAEDSLDKFDRKIYRSILPEKFKLKVKSKSIKSLISKYYNKQLDSIEINVSGNDIKLTHESLKDVHPEILDYLSVIVKQKLQLIKGQTLREFVQDYKLIKSKGVWYTFKDKSGTGEVGEVKIKLDVNDFKIIEKKSIGTHITRYKFEREKWSKTKYVLQSVSKDIYEGTHSVNIETKVIYKQSKKVWVPSQIDTKTTHTIPDSAGNKMVRKLEESFQFYDYKT